MKKQKTIKILDLFCGAGGAAYGLYSVFSKYYEHCKITGIDIQMQPHYPYHFIQDDITKIKPEFLNEIDFIWASPPCQRYSAAAKCRKGLMYKHPDLIPFTRDILRKSGKPYIIENVVGAPLYKPVMLCGSMFSLQTRCGIPLRRHRLFECTFPVNQLSCRHSLYKLHAIRVYGGGQPEKYKNKHLPKNAYSADACREAMGISWMTKKELNQAIPPAYAAYLAESFLQSIKSTAGE